MPASTPQVEAESPPEVEPAGSLPPDWYDRSSLVGDFMVMIADQTEEDYIRRAPEGRFCEFIDGTVYMAPAVDAWHQFDVQLLLVLLEMFNATHEAGIILTGPTAFKARDGCYLEPDLFVLPAGGESQIYGWYSEPPALLVLEALSKSTRSHDLNLKSSLYREAGVAEVYFIDDRDKVVRVERRTAEGYVTEVVPSGPIRSGSIPGFWFDVDWLWARPRPNVLECLNRILAGPPG